MDGKKCPQVSKNQKQSQTRKVSLPSSKGQCKINIEQLRRNFKRQTSLPSKKDLDTISDPMAKAEESFIIVKGKTGVTFSEKMYEHECLWDPDFPENPQRLKAVYKRCVDYNLISRCEEVEGRYATNEELRKCHSGNLIELLEQQETSDIEGWKALASKHDSTYFNKQSNEVAKWSAGSCVEITKKVINGQLHNGMALVRPPGHHSLENDFCGFCLFNNIGICAKVALDEGIQRILIIDWDVHHGQATQRAFYDDPRVLYVSIHRYEHGDFWPNLRESEFDYIGEGDGKGFNVNIPLNCTQLKNEDYLMIFHQLILPVAYEYNPNIVMVSCGFDAAIGCPEFNAEFVFVSAGFDAALGDQKGCMSLTPAVYAHLTSMLMGLAQGKIVLLLEGGYFEESLAESAAMTLRTLLGDPCPILIDPLQSPNKCLQETLRNVVNIHKEWWQCFKDRSFEEEDLIPIKNPHPSSLYPEKNEDTTYDIMSFSHHIPPHVVDESLKELQRLKQGTSMTVPTKRVCFVYDSFMEKHFNTIDRSYPERPARTQQIMQLLQQSQILDRLYPIKPRQASLDELSLVHDYSWLHVLNGINDLTPKKRMSLSNKYDSIYFNDHTTKASFMAAGSLLEVVDSVCDGTSRSGLAVIRPPGHHAEIGEPNGFCIVNNVAVAAEYAIKRHSMKRILIVDWDVHHGNGIQHIFESNPNVLYISIHVYRNGDFFPFSKEADSHYVGTKKGKGFNVNIPWSKGGMGDGDYISAFTRLVMPISYEFQPDLVLVSAGFDAAINDPLGGCHVSPECFGQLTHMLTSLANGKVILALEGGYNLISISYCMAMCAKALLGDPLPRVKTSPSISASNTINEVIQIHKQFWTNLMSDSCELFARTVATPVGSEGDFLTPPESPEYYTPVKETKKKGTIDDLCSKLDELNVDELICGAVGPVPTRPANNHDDGSQALILEMLNAQEMYAVVPLKWCPHLEPCTKSLPEDGLDARAACEKCQDFSENWLCLTCYKVFCGRFVDEHMLKHGHSEQHFIVLSYSDFSVWCYECESYLDHPMLDDVKRAAHISKFGY